MVNKKKNYRYDFPIIANWVAPNSKVLDLGCGDGELLNYLKKERKTMIKLDNSGDDDHI